MGTDGIDEMFYSGPVEDVPTVFVVDDDDTVRESLVALIRSIGLQVESYSSADDFLTRGDPDRHGCMLLDVRMPGQNGLEFYDQMVEQGSELPVIILTAHANVPMSVRAVQRGVVDFLEKPYPPDQLIESIRRAIEISRKRRRERAKRAAAEARLALLTPGERDVMSGIVSGKLNKVIASELDISLRTVEYRKASLMNKLGVDSNAALVSLVRWLESVSPDSPLEDAP